MTRPKNPIDRPFDQAQSVANDYVLAGHIVLQKWTCVGCGARLVGGPNKWTDNGRCDEVDGKMGCGAVTDLRDRGCGFALVMCTSPAARDKLLKAHESEGPQ